MKYAKIATTQLRAAIINLTKEKDNSEIKEIIEKLREQEEALDSLIMNHE